MKKMILAFTIILFTAATISQTPAPSKEYYLQKSKNQKTTGWVLLGGGTAMAVVGIILASSDNPESGDIYGPNFESGSLLLVAGLAADLISIPFFISSANNARKAANISFNHQKILYPQPGNFVVKSQPSITIRIRI